MDAISVLERIAGSGVHGLRNRIVDMILERFEYAQMIVRRERVGVDKILRKFVSMLDNEIGRSLYGFGAGRVKLDTKRPGGDRMRIGSRAYCVAPYISVR